MANDWFKFKRFFIRQSGAAMKVGTDGVLLGAWSSVPSEGGNVLDVGTGSGLIALMIAQRTENVHIDAVEIDKPSFNQARENIYNSSWKERMAVFNLSFQEFALKMQKKYNLIICNPPFFSNSQKARGKGRSVARHDDELKIKDLFAYGSKMLVKGGIISLILPFDKLEESIHLADHHSLFLVRLAEIKPTPDKKPARVLLQFSNEHAELEREIFAIEEGKRHLYSKRYLELTADFYLEK